MSLILLYVGDEFSRFRSLEDAKSAGVQSCSVDTHLRIEITPEDGGPMTTLRYSPKRKEWC